MSEYAPGTVAVATFCGEPGIRVSRYGHGWARLDNPDDFVNDSDAMGHFRVTDVRPLVVIDAEDREQVERLLSAYRAQYPLARGDSFGIHADNMQVALREFANPPKPSEPGKYGGVIAGDGREWIRWTTSEQRGRDWCRPHANGGTEYATWDDLDVLRVTHEGGGDDE